VKLPVQARNLVDLGYFHREAHAADEIAGCLSLAAGYLRVAREEHIDARVRYMNAYEAVFQIATAGLRAMDLRPSHKAGSRAQTIQALAWALDIDKEIMPVLIKANRERAEATYRKSAGLAPGKQEIAALLAAAEKALAVAQSRLLPGGKK
jgi:hypothetical protein